MHCTRRSVRLGAVLSFLLLAFVTSRAQLFLELEEWGRTLLFVSLGASLLVFPCVAVRWQRPKWFRGIWMVLLFLLVPMVMLVAVERLNGNFITGFLSGEEDVLANYVVYLLLYLLVFGLTGSLRGSVLTVSRAAAVRHCQYVRQRVQGKPPGAHGFRQPHHGGQCGGGLYLRGRL